MKYTLQKDGKVKITKVVEEIIDLPKLKEELKEMKTVKEPNDEELLEEAKQGMVHPYYEIRDRREGLENYIKEVESKLRIKK